LLISFGEHLAILYGNDFVGIATLIAIMAVVSLLNLYSSTMGMALVAAGKTWPGVVMNLIWGAVTLTVAVAVVPTLGALGLAISYLVGYLAHTIVQLVYLDQRVAPGCIAGQFRLIVFSLGVIFLAIMCALSSISNLLYPLGVVLISLVPATAALVRANQGA